MPSRLHFSNSLETHCQRLLESLRGLDPLEAPCIAFPTAAMRGWLQIQIAEKMGIAVNLEFKTLELLLWDLLVERDLFREAPDREPARPLDPLNFQGMVMGRLRQNPPEELKAFLFPVAEEPHDRARRLCQLSGRLASLFREYEYSRVSEGRLQGISESWNRGEPCFEQVWRTRSLPEHRLKIGRAWEQWQREIYRDLFCEGGLRDLWGASTGIYRYTLPQYAAMVLGQSNLAQHFKASETSNTPVIHLFGLSNLSPFHRTLIHQLASLGTHFEIYAFNPCREFWEDKVLLSETELMAEELPPGNEVNALLTQIGNPGRETVKLWNQITDYDFTDRFVESNDAQLLGRLQNSIMSHTGWLYGEQRCEQDPSLQIWAAPSLTSEVEGVRAHIAARLLQDPLLRMEEIAIIPSAYDDYLPALETAFPRHSIEAGQVPGIFLESGVRAGHVLAGLRMLLELGEGSIHISSLLLWLENQAVQRRFELTPQKLAVWETLLRVGGFQEGWDAAHLKSLHRSPSHSHWNMAKGRILAGRILDSSDAGLSENGWFPAAGEINREEVASLLYCMETLFQRVAPFHSKQGMSCEAWSQWILNCLDSVFKVDADDPVEAQCEMQLRKFCQDLKSWGEWDTTLLHVSLISVLLDDFFREPRSRPGSFLQGGVRIGTLTSLRGIPFRHVYWLGLSAGNFPATQHSTAMDLRSFARILGESDASAKDLYGFLEVLLNARESVVFSYVKCHPKKDVVQPSLALTLLVDFLEKHILKVTPEAPASFQHLQLNEDGRHDNSLIQPQWWGHSPAPTLRQLRLQAFRNGSESQLRQMATHTWVQAPELTVTAKLLSFHSGLRLRDVTAFLKNPAEYLCLRRNDFYDTLIESQTETTTELAWGKYEGLHVLAKAVSAELSRSGSGKPFLQQALFRLVQQGHSPPLPFSTLEMARLEKLGEMWLEKGVQSLLKLFHSKGLRYVGQLVLGSSSIPMDPPWYRHPGLDLSSAGVEEILNGLISHFVRGEKDSAWGFLDFTKHEPLSIYVIHLCRCALKDSPPNPFYFFSCPLDTNDDLKAWTFYSIPAIEEEVAQRDLRALLEDFRNLSTPELLPLETITQVEEKQTRDDTWKESIEESLREAEENSRKPTSRSKRILNALNPQVPEDAADSIQRRIQPYWNWKKSWIELDPEAV